MGCMSLSGRKDKGGLWLRLDALPVVAPWKQPETWGELRQAAGPQLAERLSTVLERAPSGEAFTLLIGCPIPRTVEGPMHLMHWQAITMPPMHSSRPRKGVPTPSKVDGYSKTALQDSAPVQWGPLENWHPDELATRGRFPECVRKKNVLLIGAGALGAPLAEHLVRGGAFNVTVVDADTFAGGNLVRHTLLMSDLGTNKSLAIAQRLNLSTPHANAVGLTSAFPSADQTAIDHYLAADLIIDATASNEVIAAMAEFDWQSEKTFVSVAIGRKAQRFYFYCSAGPSFSDDDFHTALNPYLSDEQAVFADDEVCWEGVGCYHPVFEARNDDLALWAAMGAKMIADACSRGVGAPRLVVLEQRMQDGIPMVSPFDLVDDEAAA